VVIDPQVAPAQPLPATVHETEVFDVPVIVAVNCCLSPVSSCTVTGEIATDIGFRIVTDAEADLVGSATDVAVTDT
jgi:hypothetical protein